MCARRDEHKLLARLAFTDRRYQVSIHVQLSQ